MELVNRMMNAYDDLPHTLPKPVLSGFRMAQDEKMDRLQSVPILEECTGRQLREVARITDVVEAWVREHPEQWLWVHRRWR